MRFIVTSYPHYPQYSGLMEWGQRELKAEKASVLAGTRPDMEMLQVAAEPGPARCNNLPRPCPNG